MFPLQRKKLWGLSDESPRPKPHKQEMSPTASFKNDTQSSAVKIISFQEEPRSTQDTLFGYL
jgi:hypothetical protein